MDTSGYNLEKQHKKGKLHAIERINAILDENSFVEIGSNITNFSKEFGLEKMHIPYDGVITGFGMVSGKQVCIYSQDFTILGGSLGKNHGEKISNIIKLAIKSKCPVIGINDSGGARIQEGVHSLAGYGDIFYYNTQASGYIPQISVIAGPCAGGAVYSPGLTDFVMVIDGISNMFVTGPKVVKSVTNKNVTVEQLGGSQLHSNKSGVAHFRFPNEADCYVQIRKLLSTIPHYYGEYENKSKTRYIEKDQKNIINLLPNQANKTYDMKSVITEVFDKDTFIEVQSEFAANIIVGFVKLSGIPIGIIANQPNYLAGVLDSDASDKAARFIRYCDCFEIPVVTFTDVPGFMPSMDEEEKGIIRHGAKLLYAYSEATVPKINVILRKAYGGAYIAMNSKHLGADFVYAWPNAEIAVMGAEGAVEILYNKQIATAEDKVEYKKQQIEEYNQKFLNPYIAANHGYVDAVIEPQNTRKLIFDSLQGIIKKEEIINIKKKHGNIPL
ncbi:MAG TPA: acyl-CoA carboxylase subunit beta [Epulopiscium sp.]|nr:acyl-CoA carboxylase subunit beta [Candidatus Epulonipiscium sp.]